MNKHRPENSEAIYDELQALDYLNEFTPAQQARYDFLENLLPEYLSDEQHTKQLLRDNG